MRQWPMPQMENFVSPWNWDWYSDFTSGWDPGYWRQYPEIAALDDEWFDAPIDLWWRVADEAERVVYEYLERHARPAAPRLPISCSFFMGDDSDRMFVGWSQPPRPADVIVSFDPKASKRDQARAVLYDYYHDDPLRYWSDNEAVKRCFIGGSDPRKEDHDPLLLIAAYENKNHPIWKCQGDKMTWRDMNDAVQQAIAHRRKLGPLPRSTYDSYPVVIYYYDNDKMKRITYPGESIPPALNAANTRWWAWGMSPHNNDAGKAAGLDDVHTRETDDPKKIAVERAHPGWTTKAEKQKLLGQYPWLSDMDSGSAGDWQSEGPQWDKDVAGTSALGSIVGAILAVVSAVLDVTGVGAIVGVPLAVATPFVVAAINATDTALHAGDAGAALANLGPALVQAAAGAIGKAGIKIPPAAMQALGTTVSAISKAVIAGQKKKLDYGQIWADVAAKAKSYGSIGMPQAEAIAKMIGGKDPATGRVFIQGFLAGQFLDAKAMNGIAKILQAYATFADPRIINIALLGMGIGHLSGVQQGTAPSEVGTPAKVRTSGFSVGQEAQVWDPLAWGCPPGTWKDPFSGHCLPNTPLCPQGMYFDLGAGRCLPAGFRR